MVGDRRGRWGTVRSRWRPDTPRSAHAVVVRGLASFAMLWQFLWVLAQPALWPSKQPTAWTTVAMTVAAVAWVAMLAAHLVGSRRARWITREAAVAALGLGTLSLLWLAGSSVAPEWGPASDMAFLTAGVAGLVLRFRPAVIAVCVLVVVEGLLVFDVLQSRDSVTVDPLNILYPAYALACGVLAISARLVLIRDADRVDEATANAARAERERRTEEGLATAVRLQERVLHETVLNTLTAIERGGLTSSPDLRGRLVDRCREAAGVMRDLSQRSERVLAASLPGQDLERDLASAVMDLYTAGIAVRIDCDPLDRLPEPVFAAVRTATREALNNIVRHAGAQSAWLTARLDRHPGGLGVEIEIGDDGVGFDAAEGRSRFGLSDAVTGPMSEVGGEAVVRSSAGHGTSVVLRWTTSVPSGVEPSYRPSSAGFAVPVLLVFGIYIAIQTALTWGVVESPVLNAVALLILLGTYAVVARATMRGLLPWWGVIVVLVAVGPVVYRLQGMAVGDAAGTPWVDWASRGLAALFMVVAAVGPGWAWVAVVAAWVVIQGDVIGELLSPGTAVLLAGALFGRSTRRSAIVYERARADELAQQTALAIAAEGVHRLHRRYGALRESRAVDLLEGIADGVLDPDDPGVRREAALEERFIRTVVRVDPALDPVHALATSLAVRARRGGVFLDVDLSETPATHRDGWVAVKGSLIRAVECSLPGMVARLSARSEDSTYVIRLLAPITRGEREAMTHLAVPGVLVDPADEDDPMMLWEIRQPGEVVT